MAEHWVQNLLVADGHHSIQKKHAINYFNRVSVILIIIDPFLEMKLLNKALKQYPNDELRPRAVGEVRGALIPKKNTLPGSNTTQIISIVEKLNFIYHL